MLDLAKEPGQLFVLATLLPLVSFVLLLLVGAVRAAARPHRDSGLGATLYTLTGGDQPGKTPAYVATAAIGAACVLCLVGFLLFTADAHKVHDLEDFVARNQHSRARAQEVHDAEHQIEALRDRWTGRYEWARVTLSPPGGTHPTEPGREQQEPRAAKLELGYHIDHLAAIMFVMVTLIATLIHLFSIGYMSEELHKEVEDHQVHGEDGGHFKRRGRFGRFFMFLSLFCFSMLNLVLADNLFQVFVSWELVGICSFLLIGFYYERTSASNAANKAFITNRVGDAGFIIGLLILWTYLGTFNFEDMFRQVRAPLRDHFHPLDFAGEVVRAEVVETDEATGTQTLKITNHDEKAAAPGSAVVLWPVRPPSNYHAPHAGEEFSAVANPALDQSGFKGDQATDGEHGSMPYWLLVTAGIGIFVGCVGKSAQFPLQVWLPDAMEGPTPVSALIHAATMVAAGVYLVGRCFPLFTPESRLVIAYVGGITLFVAATIAIVMTDIKKVLAYSTVSQLGFMMLALGVGGWVAGLFHLITHAFFKALLFLCSGSVIYGCHHEQEMTKMGGLYPKMKVTAITMLIGVLTIAGIPLFSGWYSKDAIIASALGFVAVYPQHFLLVLLPVVTAAITTFYMFRMWFLTFTGAPRDHHVYDHAKESPWVMTLPLVVLAFFSVTVAWGWPLWDAEASLLGQHIHHGQHTAVYADFGHLGTALGDPFWGGGEEQLPEELNVRHKAHDLHLVALGLASLAMVLGIVFAALIYYYRVLDAAQAQAQFAGVHRFLWHKWYFDEFYSAAVVRPALVVAGWCRWFDTRVIDGTVDGTAATAVRVADGGGRFDNGVIDGLANVIGNAIYATGVGLRRLQTGLLRNYILFLVLAAVGIFAALSWFVALATAG